jgi:hypothetical protein
LPDLFHEVHGSLVSSFHSCRLRYKWQYLDGYSPVIKPAPLEFGSAFHVGMQVLYDPKTWGRPLLDIYNLAIGAFEDECMRQAKAYAEHKEIYVLDPEEEVDYNTRLELGRLMLRKVASDMNRQLPGVGHIRHDFTPILVEEEAFVPLHHPITNVPLRCKCSECFKKARIHPSAYDRWEGLPVHYGVRVDAVLKDRANGYWIVDWKSASQLMKDPTFLELDAQVALYCWALIKMLNLDIRGFIYAQFLKDFPKKPKLLAYPRLGRAFSISKQARTDAVTYEKTVKKGDPQAYAIGLYAEHIEWLHNEGPQFTAWNKVFKTREQLKNEEIDLGFAVLEMLEAKAFFHRPSRIQCEHCFFQGPCLERMAGNDFQWMLDNEFLKEEPYYVVARERRKRLR